MTQEAWMMPSTLALTVEMHASFSFVSSYLLELTQSTTKNQEPSAADAWGAHFVTPGGGWM